LLGAKRRTTTRIKPTSGEKACGFLAFRGLSAAPLGGEFGVKHSEFSRILRKNVGNHREFFQPLNKDRRSTNRKRGLGHV
jgi:hypothetical protein